MGGLVIRGPGLAVSPTGVDAGSYDMPSFTVNDKGQITAASRLMFNARSFGAKGDGSTNDLAAVRAAIAAANSASASTGEQAVVVFPAGEYILGRDGTHSYSLDFEADNVVLQGVPGRSIIKHPAGMPNASVAIIRIDARSGVVIRDLVIDGNWGAVEGVTTTQQGINHADQTTDGVHYDPKNYGLMIRGSSNVLIENVEFRQIYGDGIWMGARSDDDFSVDYWAEDIQILGCRFDICARNGISLGAAQRHVRIERCTTNNIFTTAIDSEPQSLRGHSRDVTVRDNDLGGWWDPARGGSSNNIMSVVGGMPTGMNQASAARGWRIHDNRLRGGVYINTAIDLVMRGNRIEMATNGETGTFRSPIYIDHAVDAITIEDNYIYDNAPIGTFSSHTHDGAIQVMFYGSAGMTQPAGVRIRNNRIHVRNGVHGIFVDGVGGFAPPGDGAPVQSPESNTATSVTGGTLVRTGAGWSTDKWRGWTVIMGGVVALIDSNTADTLTLVKPTLSSVAWHTPMGTLASTPTAGAYRIVSASGVCDIEGNDIDCSFDGNAAGGDGIYLFNDRPGARIRIANNKIKNCNVSTSGGGGQWGIYISGASVKPIISLEIVDNKFWDDQASHTMSGAIRFSSADSFAGIGKLVMHGNSLLGGVTTLLSGVSSGYWLLRDGTVQEWTGYGSPESVVTASVGSTYRRVDGGTGTTLYVKESGTSNTGWSAK